jgi:hypothetical protein
MAAHDGARVRLNGATHRAVRHSPYALDGRHLPPDQMRHAARCCAVTTCHRRDCTLARPTDRITEAPTPQTTDP